MQPTTLTPRQQQEIHAQVAAFLGKSRSFGHLSPAQRAQVQADTEAVVRAMTEGGTHASPDPYANLPYPQAQLVIPRFFRPGTNVGGGAISNVPNANVGKIVSGGARQMMEKQIGPAGSIIDVGVQEAAKMVREIDFPAFVAKLIEGTFHAIVKSSIEQMRAYSDMVRSVSTSLNDFRDRNTTDNQAMDHLVSRYPSLLQVQVTDAGPSVTVRDSADTDNLPDFQKDLGLSEPITDLDDEAIATKLIPAARDDLARGRQQLLATIILMGINRIVVTDGKINAKIKFNFSANENRQLRASAYDYGVMGQTMSSSKTAKDFSNGGDGTDTTAPVDTSGLTADQKYALLQQQLTMQAAAQANRYAIGYDEQSSVTPDVRVTSEVDLSQEGAIQAAGQIMGEVQINFKSDTFPLEKLVDTDQLQRLAQAQGAGRGAPPPPAPGAAPASASAGSPSTGAPAMPPPAAPAAAPTAPATK